MVDDNISVILTKYDITCPITLQIFKKPAIASDGFNYEYKYIKKIIETTKRSPITNEELNDHITINKQLKMQIDEALGRLLDNELFKNYSKTKEYDCCLDVKSIGFTKLQYLFVTFPNDTNLLKDWVIKEKINKKNKKGWTVLHMVAIHSKNMIKIWYNI